MLVEAADRVLTTFPPSLSEKAARSLVRGIERRSRWIVLPRFHRGALIAPAPVQLVIEAGIRRLGIGEELRRRHG